MAPSAYTLTPIAVPPPPMISDIDSLKADKKLLLENGYLDRSKEYDKWMNDQVETMNKVLECIENKFNAKIRS